MTIKKFISILLLTAITGGICRVDELAKVPSLIHHFSEHKLMHPHDSVWKFLVKHYIFNQQAESDQDRRSDSRMPFKSMQGFHSEYTPFIMDNKSFQVVSCKPVNMWNTFKESKISAGFFDIWQPPKIS